MLAKQLAEIVENDQLDKIVPFLQNLGDRKKEVVPALKKLHKEYSQYLREIRSDGGITMTPKAKGDQLLILSMTAFVCCDEKGFASMYGTFILSKSTMDRLLPWYCPPWFSSFINKYAHTEYIPFGYELYLEWAESKYVQPSDELIAKLLPSHIFQASTERFKHVYAPQNLLKYPVTLAQHIWLVFQYESFIHGSDRYMSFSDGSKEGRWITTFQDLIAKNHLDRKRVLREALLATNRNFNQALSGWFSQLFIELKPELQELNELCSELLNSLNSNSSKQVNIGLKFLKSLIGGGFCPENLIDYLNITINSNTKSIVIATLSCLEEMAKRKLQNNAALCNLASLALIHADETIQTRAAKFIQKYGEETSEPLRETISTFSDTLFINSKTILSSFLMVDNSNSLTEIESQESGARINNDVPARIEPVDTFEELLFLASQAFDNNESWHLEHLADSLLLLQQAIKGDNINKLSPALQRAFKLFGNDFRMGIGYLDNLLATFFIEYSATLIERFPADSAELQKLFNKYSGAETWKSASGLLSQWHQHNKSAIYQPFKSLLLDVLNFLKQSVEVPLLCCPDYYPCRVSAVSLVERLKVYQTKKIKPSLTDFQIAVSRVLTSNRDELKQLAESDLKGEFKDLLIYLIDPASSIPLTGQLKPVWLVASIQKSVYEKAAILTELSALQSEYLTGNFEWTARAKQRYLKIYDREQQKYIDGREITTDRELRIIFPEKFKTQTTLKKIVKINNNSLEASIYDYLEMSGWISAEAFDIKRLLYLVPDNPSPVLAQIIFKCLVFSKCWEEAEKRLLTKTLEALLELGIQNAEMVNLFIAGCLLNSDKTISNYAAELWIRGIATDTLDNERIGICLGILEKCEYGPLKRLTDLILSSMFKISQKHDMALEVLVVCCISQMSDEPINNTKKLLDLYRELLLINKTEPTNPALIMKLNQWKINAGLKKTVDSILHK